MILDSAGRARVELHWLDPGHQNASLSLSKYLVTLPFGKSQSDSPVNHYCLIAIHGLNFEGDTHEVHQPS